MSCVQNRQRKTVAVDTNYDDKIEDTCRLKNISEESGSRRREPIMVTL